VLLYNDYYTVEVTKKNAFHICHPREGTKIRDQKKAPKNVRVYREKVLNVVAVIINNMTTPPPRSLQVIACIYTYINTYNIYLYVCMYSNLWPKFTIPFYTII